MRPRRAGERGQVAVYAVLLFPVLMLVLALVLAVGTIEGLRTRLRAQLDMAALTATQALSEIAAAAQVVISNLPGTDPITGASNTAPTVSIEITAPARIPLLGLAGIAPVVTLTIDGSASART